MLFCFLCLGGGKTYSDWTGIDQRTGVLPLHLHGMILLIFQVGLTQENNIDKIGSSAWKLWMVHVSLQRQMKELMVRAIYCEMLGYDASFSYINAIKLAQQGSALEKRVGMLFL